MPWRPPRGRVPLTKKSCGSRLVDWRKIHDAALDRISWSGGVGISLALKSPAAVSYKIVRIGACHAVPNNWLLGPAAFLSTSKAAATSRLALGTIISPFGLCSVRDARAPFPPPKAPSTAARMTPARWCAPGFIPLARSDDGLETRTSAWIVGRPPFPFLVVVLSADDAVSQAHAADASSLLIGAKCVKKRDRSS